MMNEIRKLFRAPVFEEDEKNRASEILNTLINSLIFLFIFGLTTMILLDNLGPFQIGVIGLTIVILIGLRIPLKKGYIQAVSWFITITLTLIISIALTTLGTVRIPAVSIYVLVSVIAGLTIGQRAAFLSSLVNILIVSSLVWAEYNGLISPQGRPDEIQQILGFAIAAILTVILINLALKSIQSSLNDAEQNQNKLTKLTQELEQIVAARTQALETSTEISRRLSTILDQEQLAREVVEQLQSAFGYYHAHIYLYDETQNHLVMVGGTGNAGRVMLAQGHKLVKGHGLVGKAAATNQAILIPNVSQAEGWLPNPLLPETKSEVAVPITIGNNVLGVLDVQHNITNGLSEVDADLIRSIASQVAIATQNALAFSRSQQKAEREAQITAISQRIQSAMTIEDVLQIAVSELGSTLGAANSTIDLEVKNMAHIEQN
jgi:putative methionine-R-sulfoxide reductase with GAF domain